MAKKVDDVKGQQANLKNLKNASAVPLSAGAIAVPAKEGNPADRSLMRARRIADVDDHMLLATDESASGTLPAFEADAGYADPIIMAAGAADATRTDGLSAAAVTDTANRAEDVAAKSAGNSPAADLPLEAMLAGGLALAALAGAGGGGGGLRRRLSSRCCPTA